MQAARWPHLWKLESWMYKRLFFPVSCEVNFFTFLFSCISLFFCSCFSSFDSTIYLLFFLSVLSLSYFSSLLPCVNLLVFLPPAWHASSVVFPPTVLSNDQRALLPPSFPPLKTSLSPLDHCLPSVIPHIPA